MAEEKTTVGANRLCKCGGVEHAPSTLELKLTGEKNEKIDSLVAERGKDHVYNVEQVQRWKARANESGEALRGAFRKSKGKRSIRIQGELGMYYLGTADKYQLVVKKEKTVN